MIRSLKTPIIIGAVLGLASAVMAPVFSSGHLSNSADYSRDVAFYRDSLERNPPCLLQPDDVQPPLAHQLFDSLLLEQKGLTIEVLYLALKGHQELVEKGLVEKENILSICDFSQSSRKKRLYVFDLNEKKLVLHTFVAHGRNSGDEFAKSFSNAPESHKSSLGFYVTDHSYFGEHGLALRLKGVEKGFNDKAFQRAIVVHGSDYVNEQFIKKNRFMGRSFGCPAVPFNVHKTLINTIKNGSSLFIYHPTKQYLDNSKMINT
jgi:hypothetical protein